MSDINNYNNNNNNIFLQQCLYCSGIRKCCCTPRNKINWLEWIEGVNSSFFKLIATL